MSKEIAARSGFRMRVVAMVSLLAWVWRSYSYSASSRTEFKQGARPSINITIVEYYLAMRRE